MHILSRGIPKENVRQIFDPVSFIVFNYDRCVEQFLFHALQKQYGIGDNEAKAIVDDLTIIHPYGAVDNEVEFGATKADFVALAAGIKTYTEQVGNAEIVARLGDELARAKAIVFLGFAYHNPNMTLLKPKEPMSRKMIYGTAYKMSDADIDVVSHQIAGFMAGGLNSKLLAYSIKLENKRSNELFDHYAKSLSGGD